MTAGKSRASLSAMFVRQLLSLTVLIVLGVPGPLGSAMNIPERLHQEILLSQPREASRIQTPPEQQVKTAEQVYKNIQVFKGMPASELEPAMAFISGSLGVKCSYCHVNPFEKDEKPTKQTARQMIKMVFEINRGNFRGEKAVSCFTCHQGKPAPVSVPAVGANLWQPAAGTIKEKVLPTADEVLRRYVQAMGGEQALRKINSRVAKGSRIGADGVLVPEEVHQKAPNKILTVTIYPQNTFSNGFNGIAAWGSSSKDGVRELPEALLAQIKSDAEFYKEVSIKELYRQVTLVGSAMVGDAEAYVIKATAFDGSSEKLFFDTDSGLLLRRYKESEIPLGKFPLQTDYEDYREVDGVKQPFLIRWSMPGRSWGRKIDEVKQNVPVDDSRFNPPAKP